MSIGKNTRKPVAAASPTPRTSDNGKSDMQPTLPKTLSNGCGYAPANAGHDTKALQAWLGHKHIQHKVRYTELARD
jgi:hypothetical protein